MIGVQCRVEAMGHPWLGGPVGEPRSQAAKIQTLQNGTVTASIDPVRLFGMRPTAALPNARRATAL